MLKQTPDFLSMFFNHLLDEVGDGVQEAQDRGLFGVKSVGAKWLGKVDIYFSSLPANKNTCLSQVFGLYHIPFASLTHTSLLYPFRTHKCGVNTFVMQ